MANESHIKCIVTWRKKTEKNVPTPTYTVHICVKVGVNDLVAGPHLSGPDFVLQMK